MVTEADKELRLNILVTREGNGALHRALAAIGHPKRRAKHLLHLALTGLYAEAFLHASPTVLSRAAEPFRDSAAGSAPAEKPAPAPTPHAPPVVTADGGNRRTGLELVDIENM